MSLSNFEQNDPVSIQSLAEKLEHSTLESVETIPIGMDTDSEDELMIAPKQRLPVGLTFTTYDPNVPPANGEEYLRRVQLELEQELDTVVADNAQELLGIRPAKDYFSEFQEDQFKPCTNPVYMITEDCKMNRLLAWDQLRSAFDQAKHSKALNSHARKVNSQNKKWWREHCLVNSPEDASIMLIASLSQAELAELVQFHLDWLTEDDDNEDRVELTLGMTVWLRSLLAGLDFDQTGHVHSILRQLSRVCSQIRHGLMLNNHLEEETKNGLINSCSLLISIVAERFGQADLKDPCKEDS